MKPGVGLNLPLGAKSEITATAQTWDQILLHVVPESVIRAMAEGDVLQIVRAQHHLRDRIGMIGEKGKPVGNRHVTFPSNSRPGGCPSRAV